MGFILFFSLKSLNFKPEIHKNAKKLNLEDKKKNPSMITSHSFLTL